MKSALSFLATVLIVLAGKIACASLSPTKSFAQEVTRQGAFTTRGMVLSFVDSINHLPTDALNPSTNLVGQDWGVYTTLGNTNPSTWVRVYSFNAPLAAGVKYTDTAAMLTPYQRKSGIKLGAPYSGTTNASGDYAVTFSSAYSVAPNIQANIIGGTANQFILISSISTTGFSVKTVQRSAVTLLGIEVLLAATTNLSGANVHVLITPN